MKHRLIINSDEVKARAIYMINNLDISIPREVIIREHKVDRSANQNSIYWQWITIIGAELGETKDDLHERYKGQFLAPIYERDNPEYAEMTATLRNLYRKDKQTATYLRAQVIKLTSTRDASVKQFTEYLNDIEAEAMGLNIRLPHPEDIE